LKQLNERRPEGHEALDDDDDDDDDEWWVMMKSVVQIYGKNVLIDCIILS
jgi:hypothetical protein